MHELKITLATGKTFFTYADHYYFDNKYLILDKSTFFPMTQLLKVVLVEEEKVLYEVPNM